jgi:hypothetical protein
MMLCPLSSATTELAVTCIKRATVYILQAGSSEGRHCETAPVSAARIDDTEPRLERVLGCLDLPQKAALTV